MRFVCDSCRAQYMISDEKVGAKGVKVRCKKCGFVILVRRADAPLPVAPPESSEGDDASATQVLNSPFSGGAEGGPTSPTGIDLEGTQVGGPPTSPSNVLGGVDDDEIGAVFDQVLSGGKPAPEAKPALGDDDDDRMSTRVLDADTVKKLAQESGSSLEAAAPRAASSPSEPSYDWFVAIDEKQVGPLTVEKLKDHWNRGEITPESLCWRAGFSDWLPLAEVTELASVLAPKAAKPVIVSPAAVSGPVMSVQVESAFNSGGVTKTVRSEMQVPLAAAPVEETLGGWKPSAASGLASLVKEEIEALTKPKPRGSEATLPPAPAAAASSSTAGRGLLDLPAAEGPAAPAARTNGASAPRPPVEPGLRGQPISDAYSTPSKVYTSPGFSTYKPPPKRGLMIGLIAGGALLFLVLVGLVGYLAARQPTPPPVAIAPPPVVPAPAPVKPSEPVKVAEAPKVAAPTPAAADPAATASAPAAAATPPPPTEKPAAAEPEKPAKPAPVAAASERPSRRAASSAPSEGTVVAKAAPAPTEKPKPEVSGDDDEFSEVFGSPGTKKVATPSAPAEKKKTAKDVYIPPAPGQGNNVPDTLGQSDIMQVVLSNRPSLVKCGQEQKKREPGVSGKLVMRWLVQPSGKTSNVSVASEEFKSTYMASCIGGLIKGWTFPRHKATGGFPVTFPFNF